MRRYALLLIILVPSISLYSQAKLPDLEQFDLLGINKLDGLAYLVNSKNALARVNDVTFEYLAAENRPTTDGSLQLNERNYLLLTLKASCTDYKFERMARSGRLGDQDREPFREKQPVEQAEPAQDRFHFYKAIKRVCLSVQSDVAISGWQVSFPVL